MSADQDGESRQVPSAADVKTGDGPRRSAAGLEDDPGISLLRLLNTLLRRRRLVIGASILLGVLGVAWGLVLPRSYTVGASFMPQEENPRLGQFQGLAAQLGMDIPLLGDGQSTAFYADLLRTRGILREAVETRYEISRDGSGAGMTGDLVDFFEPPGDTPDIRRAEAIRTLRESMEVSALSETGIVEFSVTTRWPELSRAVGDRLIELVNEFNLETRQSQAGAEREFLERRVEEAEGELREAERRLELFLEQNRGYDNSPSLRFEYERIQRRVSLQEQVYSSLAQSLEQAKIEEVRNTPVITVVDPVELPPRPDRRYLILRGTLGIILGGFLAGLVAVGAEFLREARRREPEEYLTFRELWTRTTSDLRAVRERIASR